MTQVITRYFENASRASLVKKSLQFERFPTRDLVVYTDPDGLADALKAENVEAEAAKAYETKLKSGGAVLLARATFKPLGAAKLVRQKVADMGAADMGNITEEVYVKDSPGKPVLILNEHPLFLTRRLGVERAGHYMADWPIPLLSRRKPQEAFLFPRHARMANFPIPLLSDRKPFTGSIFRRHARMANFPIPLLSRRKPFTGSIIGRHARMANFPIPLLSKRKPYNRTAIGRHTRMANWPFPLLINGETGTNSLVPNGARMANFPIPLLSRREPADKFAFPRHARMAKFPISLISKRKPYTGSAIPRHGRMANMFLPLIIKHAESKATANGEGFSFSRMIGMPTIKHR